MVECAKVHYNPEEIIRGILAELPQLLEQLFIDEQGDSSPCTVIQRGVYLSGLWGTLSLN